MEHFGSTSRGGFSVRSIFTFALVVVVTALLWAIFGTASETHAADATWKGASILHDGHQYYGAGKAEEGESHNLAVGTQYYLYTPSPQSGSGAPTSASKKAFIIYFAPGVDPPTATSANYVEYDYNPTTKTFSNPSNTKTISVTANGDELASSCAIEGVGWIVCSASVFLAQGMDWVFGVIAGFMEVQPLTVGNTNGDLYVAWNVMRGFANIAFIIAFIIIIYSQLTNVGLSNYGLKRLLPRLIIAAILVNVSYIICAIAVDISNILGYSLQDIFIQLRNQIFNVDNDTWGASMISWESITGFVLSGGTATLALGIGAVTAIAGTGGTVLGAIFLLLPVLLGLLLAILVVLLILAARQAIITILVVIAPLAFVAYLLPNTEKYFDKWRGLFMTMLIFFPAFAVVFGGSQLAGALIIQNASSINLLILGMIVQVAPLVITPFLLKFSGTLLGNIARLVNDPNKGVLDRTRKWAGAQAEYHRLRGIGGSKMNGAPGELRKRNFMRRASAGLNNMNRRVEDRTGLVKTGYDNAYHSTPGYEKISENQAAHDFDKDYIHNKHQAHIEREKIHAGSDLYERAMRVQTSKQKLEGAQNQATSYYNRESTLTGTSLNASNNYLEVTKSQLETSENMKTAYVKQQRTVAGTALNATVAPLEASKLWVERGEARYSTMVENMKLDGTSEVNLAARYTQASKTSLEAAQAQVETLYVRERSTTGTALNLATVELENAKVIADGAKAHLTKYVTDLKSEIGTSLHEEVIRTERHKQGQQVAEERLTRIITEYKAGGSTDATGNTLIDDVVISPTEQVLLEQMQQDGARLAAQQQGTTSARYVQQEYISTLMDEASTDPLTAEVLRVAGGIDPNGRIRAQANAISQIGKLEQDALNNSVTLLGDRAEKQGTTLKGLAKDIYAKHVGKFKDATGVVQPREEQDATILEAALEALAQDGDISTLRDARLDTNAAFVDQNMLTRLFARNASNMKAKGGFDLQADPSLAGASQQKMDASIAGTLGDVTAASISGQKAGWWDEVSTRISDIYSNADSFVYDATDPTNNAVLRKKKIDALETLYHNLTAALRNPNVLKDIGDRLEPTIKMHEFLHTKFNDPTAIVNYDLARRGGR